MNFKTLLNNEVSKLTRRRILIIDGDDKRAIDAAKELEKYSNLEIILLTEKNENINTKAQVLNMFANEEKIEELANKYFELRKGKEDIETSRKVLRTRPFYAMMLLANNEIDGVVGGLNYSTADILRAAFKAIGPKKGIKTISSVMIMHKEEMTYFFTDISVNPKPELENLVDIAKNASDFAKSFNVNPKVAFLSFSTSGSAKTDETIKVSEAAKLFNESNEGIKAIGEVQFDTAISENVRKAKYSGESFGGEANIFVFPDLNAGNIGYKIAQRLGNFGAIGPIITGVNKPVNDLSRGSTVEDVVNTVLITSLQSKK
ncbi:phosphate acetyltransferase(phosphotransacetylase) [Mycoplasmopsis maculosa]|uniref:Phosphate acetyltransferase(Phosphotransacetylase) n=1 Tax=Mycoplasmopsis maculosa TaxID=114885 RepID=A0A449B4E4_9BACT|nr:phosphate acetyltransferase [Mycoplasmopsis maculosa]VEU75467.1 phosphate acetyltransferase(phosphotransacetylase) [Mycoplasmopsis maculosa]